MLSLFYILEMFLALVLFLVFILLLVWIWTIFTVKVPFVPVPKNILKDIEKAMFLSNDSMVYDLGSGDGRVLFYLSNNNPNAKYFGIEKGAFPLLLSRILNMWQRKSKNSNVRILKKDFFEQDLSDATHIFTYLYPNVMDDLLPKLEKELKSGTRLVSAAFKFTTKKPMAEIDLKRGKWKLARKIYVYEF